VIGFLTANEVLDFMNWVANLPPDYAEQLNKNEQEKLKRMIGNELLMSCLQKTKS